MPETANSDIAAAISPAPLADALTALTQGLCADTDNAARLVAETA
jgi:hypothetical protein